MALTDNLNNLSGKYSQLQNLNDQFNKVSGVISKDQDSISAEVSIFDPLQTTDPNDFANEIDALGNTDLGLPTSVGDVNDLYQTGLGIKSSVNAVAADLGLPIDSDINDVISSLGLPENSSLEDVLKIGNLSSDSSFENMAETLGFRNTDSIETITENLKLPSNMTKDDLMNITRAGLSPEVTDVAGILADAGDCFPGIKDAWKNITDKDFGMPDIKFPDLDLHFPFPPIKFPTLPKLPFELLAGMAAKIGDSIGEGFSFLLNSESGLMSLFSKLKGLIELSGIGKLIGDMDKLIDCLTESNYETSGVSDIVDNVNTTTSDLNLNEEDNFRLDGKAYVESLPQDNPDLVTNLEVTDTKHEEQYEEQKVIQEAASDNQVTQNNAPIVEQKKADVPPIPPKDAGNIDPVTGLPITTYADNMVIGCQAENKHGYSISGNKPEIINDSVINFVIETTESTWEGWRTLSEGNVQYDVFYLTSNLYQDGDIWIYEVTIIVDIDSGNPLLDPWESEYEYKYSKEPSTIRLVSAAKDAYRKLTAAHIRPFSKEISGGFTTAPSRETAK